jgi:uncharacterized repeat protein (TIGR02543 family)
VRTGGYTFGGWYRNADGTGAAWDFDSPVTADLTLYAKWTQIKYTVTFYMDSVFNSAVDVAHGNKASMPTDIASKANYDFDGWYTATDYTTKWNFNSPVTADITLYARWLLASFSVAIAEMAKDMSKTEAAYTIGAGTEAYVSTLVLTAENRPAQITIDGSGRVITGSTNSITVGAGITLTLKNITFKTLPFSVAAGGTLVLGGEGVAAGSAVVQGNTGTGITVNGGTLEMNTGALVTANSSSGVLVQANGVFTMSGGEISGNIWPNGGMYYYGGGVQINAGIFNMSGGEISSNYADLGGGVSIWDAGKFNMSGGVIKNNSVEFGGAGVHVQTNCIFKMTGGEITGNSCDRLEYTIFGGGVYLEGGTLTGDPRIGNPVTSGSGSGWIYGNIPNDVR